MDAPSKPAAPTWNIRRIVKNGEYLLAVVPEHPRATKHGYVSHHRVVVENALGRVLESDEHVHHKNGDKKDNLFDNLEVVTPAEHIRLHKTGQRRLEMYGPPKHGTIGMYRNSGCRCELCRTAWNEACKRWKRSSKNGGKDLGYSDGRVALLLVCDNTTKNHPCPLGGAYSKVAGDQRQNVLRGQRFYCSPSCSKAGRSVLISAIQTGRKRKR